ncbi:MAG TPA: glycosyltransferase [Actinomycetes bacterium]|nr:glycosyltransferase [Actinomycetes bacterium]
MVAVAIREFASLKAADAATRGGILLRAIPLRPSRETWNFALIGAAVAVLGHAMLALLIAAGWTAALANVIQAVVTLQFNFWANRHLTWRRRITGSPVRLWRRWGRFHLARGASLLVSVAAFPIVAPRVGPAIAYWSLLAAACVVNFYSDKYWSFRATRASVDRRPRHAARGGPARRLLVVGLAAAPFVLLAVLSLDWFLLATSSFMLVVATTTLAFQLYKWWRPENNDADRYGEPDEPRLPGVILVPMRHEEAVAGQTLARLARLNHPDYRVVSIIDHPDDPGTAAIAHAKAREHPGRLLVCPYPENTGTHNKPIALNAALRMLEEQRVPFEWVGVADAEDLFHHDLLRMVDYRFRATGAGIVQCGVQLMNFGSDRHSLPLPRGRLPRGRRWWRAHASGWWRASNVLEYFKWFQSRLKLQAAVGVMPLGGNTVFFRREFLDAVRRRYGAAWDETCLTEDAKIGITASVLGYKVDVVYLDELVTREETPPTLGAFVRQRVRWMQGFMQVFAEGEWLRLPTLTQRVLAVYVLGFQFFQAFAGVLAPVALALAVVHKAPVLLTLLATLPLGMGVLNVLLDVVLLAKFGRAFGEKVRLRDYAGLIVGAYPFQVVLSTAAVWALARFALNRGNWVKTVHQGAHLRVPRAGQMRTAMAEDVV